MKHKYADVICAWANGKTIQYKYKDEWHDIEYDEKYRTDSPDWTNLDVEWRIKPEYIKYRVALMKDEKYGYYTSTADEAVDVGPINSPNFIKWITDWITLEVVV